MNGPLAPPRLTVVLGRSDRIVQRAHLDRGALFVPEPSPLPEPFGDIVLRVEDGRGAGVELAGRVLQILPGRGIAVSFDDLPGAKRALAPIFDAPADVGPDATSVVWGDAAAGKTDPAEPLELNETAKLEAEIAALSGPQKIQLAMKGERAARVLLLKDPNKAIQTFLLQNPRISIDEVKTIAAYRQASAEALNAIAAHREWTGNVNVVTALVRNPKTPGATAVRMMEKLPMADIRRMAKSNDVPPAVMAAARKKVADGK